MGKTNKKSVITVSIMLGITLVIGISLQGMRKKQYAITPSLSEEKSAVVEAGLGAHNYNEVYDALRKNTSNSVLDFFDGFLSGGSDKSTTSEMADGTGSSAPSMNGAQLETSTEEDYGSTNIQVAGVDEGDIIKNDGSYLYVVQSSFIRILKPDGMKVEEVSQIPWDGQVSQLYVTKNHVIIIGTLQESSPESSDNEIESAVAIYDLSNPAQPVQKKLIHQDGYIATSRLTDGYLYLFTQKYVWNGIKKESIETYVPCVDGTAIAAEDICVPQNIQCNSYLVLSAIDVESSQKVMDTKAILMGNGEYYVSENHIYIADERYDEKNGSVTNLTKYGYSKGCITPEKTAEITGSVNNSFSMDEYNGNLRMVTTSWNEKGSYEVNNLYVLDENLAILGKIEDLAEDETIRSARFMGDIGYFVTFKQTDPLFSVDLSNPCDPKILGALKITGFSSYLHFYSDSLLLGIGQEVNPKTNRIVGLKLSMFDISNPCDVKEVNKLVIPESTYGEMINNHKAVLIQPEKNMIGFGYESNFTSEQKYVIYSYDPQSGFHLELEETAADYESMNQRGTYIGNTLYVAFLGNELTEIHPYNWSTKEKGEVITFGYDRIRTFHELDGLSEKDVTSITLIQHGEDEVTTKITSAHRIGEYLEDLQQSSFVELEGMNDYCDKIWNSYGQQIQIEGTNHTILEIKQVEVYYYYEGVWYKKLGQEN